MNKRLLLALVATIGLVAAWLVLGKEGEKKTAEKSTPDAGADERPTVERNGRSLIPPPIERAEKVEAAKERPPEEREPPPPIEQSAMFGLDVSNTNESELRDAKVPEGMTGVRVSRVHPASPAAEARLEKGDVIVRAQRDKITDPESLRAAVGDRDHTVLTVYRNGFPFQVVLRKPFHGDP